MAKTNVNTTTTANTPAYQAWNVTRKGEQSFWSKIGAAWMHKDQDGFTIQLDVIPMKGVVVLRKPYTD